MAEEEDKKTEEVKEESESKNVKDIKSEFEKLKEYNDAIENELLRKEELRARVNLMGKAEAGETKEKPKEETPAEYTKRIMSGEGKYGEQ